MSIPDYQTTLERPVHVAGIGVHNGARARIVMKPAPAGTGIVFDRTDLNLANTRIPALATLVTDTQLGTTLSNGEGADVAVVEHLLAACAGMGLDNAIIEIDGAEVPIMDGSSSVFCELIASGGLKQLTRLRRRIRVLDTVEVRNGKRFARLSPSTDTCLTLRARINFESSAIGVQEMAMRLRPGLFARDLAFARTFGFARDVETLKAMGLARGGSLDNAVVIDGDDVVNPEGLRAKDEFVRHKVLDAVGDLFLVGGQIAGTYEADQPGHAINNQLVRALLEQPETWCWESIETELSEAVVVSAAAAV